MDTGNCFASFCFVCSNSIFCSNSGLAQLFGHANSSKHRQAIKVCEDKSQSLFLFKSPTPGISQQGGGDYKKEAAFLKTLTDQITKAESLWAMQFVFWILL